MNEGPALVRSGQLLYTDDVGKTPAASAASPPGTASRRRSRAESPDRAQSPGAPRRRLRRRRRRRRPHRQIPQAFFKEEAKRLRFDRPSYLQARGPPRRRRRLLPRRPDAAKIDAGQALVRDVLAGGPVQLLGCAARADERRRRCRRRPGAPGPGPSSSALPVERRPGRRRGALPLPPPAGTARSSSAQAGLDAYVPSLSARLVSYKGLLTSPQFADFYADLTDPAFETGHRHLPPPLLAPTPSRTGRSRQPFRLTRATTARSTRSARTATRSSAYARGLNPPLPGGDLLTPK